MISSIANNMSDQKPSVAKNNPVRQLLDQNPSAIDSFLSYDYGMCAPRPLNELLGSFRLWETWAKTLPFLYKSGKYREFFDNQPVLSIEDLSDEDLLRANQILGLCAHAVVHFSEEDALHGGVKGATESIGTNTIRGGWITERKPPSCPFKSASTNTIQGDSTTENAPRCPFKPSKPSASVIQEERPKSKSEIRNPLANPQGDWITEDAPRCPFKPSAIRKEGSTSKNPKSESRIPSAIREPWTAVNKRLGRPLPTFTYYDYFTLNVVHKHEPRGTLFDLSSSSRKQYENLRSDVAVFGEKAENVFVIVNYDVEFQSIPLVRLSCDATDCVVNEDTVGLTKVLVEMGNIVSKVTEAFLLADPNSHSDLFCDPVSWSKSIGILIPPIVDEEMSMSGLQSSFTHLVDGIIGRHEYTGELGDLAKEEIPWLPSLHQEFFRRLSLVSIRGYVLSSTDGNLHGSFNRLVRLFVDGFLEAHRLKMMGFLELGLKTGRSQTSGQTAKAGTGWQGRVWRKVNEDCLHSMVERAQLQTRPAAQGFTGAFVESITRVTPGGESYKVVFNTAGSGIQYEAGDRVQVLPRNPPSIIARMLAAMQIEGGLPLPIVSPEWRSAVEQHYPEMGHQPVLPIASLLRIMVLRPLSKTVVTQVCKGLKIRDDSIALDALRAGKLDDVPDLIEFLRQSCGFNASEKDISGICSFLSPLSPRLYSVASAPCRNEASQSKVSIVISRVWYQAASVIEGKAEDRLGVATSCLLNDSLYNHIPIRIVEEKGFRLPEPSFSGSILLIALGTGASPMFGFIEELLNRRNSGTAVKLPEVFFCWGLAGPADLFGVPLLERAVREIGLKLCVSFSRDHKTVRVEEDGKIEIVEGRRERITTTLLKDDWPRTISRLAKGSGLFYLCGHPSLGNTVRSVIEHALATSGMLSLTESQQQYARVVAGKRVRSDMFFSGSVHNPKLPSYSAAEVATHNRLDDIWLIYKDYVYDVTEYMNLHPGGNKILFDKAGRDATEDFEAAHGPNNKRVESMMLTYRIGRLSVPKFNAPSDREAYGLVLKLLHTVCEVRNVYYLDVNIFEGANETAGSAHSLAMRAKTHNKFVTSSVPMLYNAMACFQGETDSLYKTSSKSCPRLVPSDLKIMQTFRDSLHTVLLSIPDSKTILATELCQVGKDFLSEFLDSVTCFAATVDYSIRGECASMLSIPGLQDMCNRAQQRLEHVFNSIDVSALDREEYSSILRACGSLSGYESLVGADLRDTLCLQLRKGDCIFREGDILDIVYVVLEGSVTAQEMGIETDHFPTGTAFGATKRAHQIAPQKQMLGNQTMSYGAMVASEACRIAILHPMQVLISKTTGIDRVDIDDILFDGSASSTSSLTSTANDSVYQSLFKKAVFRVTAAQSMHVTIKSLAIRKSNLMEYFPLEACDALALESSEVSIKSGHVLAKAGDMATKCWILVEGCVGVEVNDRIVWKYTKAGQIFGERGFAMAVRKTDEVFFKETVVAMKGSRVLEIPREAIDKICNGPLKKECRALMKLDFLISKHPVLNQLPRSSRYGLLRIFRQVRIPAREVLFERGEAGDSAFVVMSGKLEFREQDVAVSELNPGDGTGFDMLLQPGERDLTCVAVEATTCWTVNHQALIEGLRVGSRRASKDRHPKQEKSKTKTKRTGKKKRKEETQFEHA